VGFTPALESVLRVPGNQPRGAMQNLTREIFDQARALAASLSSRKVVMVRPDLSVLELACPAAESLPRDIIERAETILSSKLRRNVSVVALTGFGAGSAKAEVGSPVWNEAGKTIPFFGILTGLASIGHSVWVFDVMSDLEAACRDSDILIIDSEVAGSLADDRITAARRVMRGSSVFIHDRSTYQLRPVASEKLSGDGWAAVFHTARLYTHQGDRRQIVMVRPDKSLLCLPCIPQNAMTADHRAQAHQLIPEGSPRNVVVIAPTELDCDPPGNGVPSAVAQLRAAGKAIPFFGLLLNLASAGNPLWIFEGQKEAVPHGCRQADLLFIDSILAGKLTTKTLDDAAHVMRSGNIAVYDRNSRKIALLRHVGPTPDKLEFRD
jgi:hypothetical protein